MSKLLHESNKYYTNRSNLNIKQFTNKDLSLEIVLERDWKKNQAKYVMKERI